MLSLGLAALGLLWRGVDLQITDKDFLKNQGDARHLRVVDINATRGRVVDRNGQPLAISTPVDSVWVNPKQLVHDPERWLELLALLHLDAAYLERLLAGRGDREFIYLKRHVDPVVAKLVANLGLPGVHMQREYRRYYPTGEVAAHVVGFTNVDDVGQEGVELAFEHGLRGSNGAKRVVKDGYGQIIEEVEYIKAPSDGAELVLSLDRRIQFLAYRALKSAVQKHGALGGSVVVLDSRTGEVLAMANQPAYNPNSRTDRVGARFRNRAVTDLFEPGSTVKPFTVASALETGRLKPESDIDTHPGVFRVGKYKVSDLRDYGVIDVATVLKVSSNIGASKIALAVPAEQLRSTFDSVGFGTSTASGFPGEAGGFLSDSPRWSDIERATLSFGYGLSVTPLQLARAYSVIASGGLMYPITFQKADVPVEPERVLPAHATLQVRTMLEAVTGPDGTGKRARISGYRVAGKTGTVRKATVGGYVDDRYVAVFAGMAPASSPRLVAAVIIDEPQGKEYYGGQVAAPVFAEVMAGALRLRGVAPDARVSEAGQSDMLVAGVQGASQ